MCCIVGGPNHNLHMREKRRIKKKQYHLRHKETNLSYLKTSQFKDRGYIFRVSYCIFLLYFKDFINPI